MLCDSTDKQLVAHPFHYHGERFVARFNRCNVGNEYLPQLSCQAELVSENVPEPVCRGGENVITIKKEHVQILTYA